jgi:hypothetical protein
MYDTPSDTLWVCQCCMLASANGECCQDHARDESERVTEPGNFYTGPIQPTPMPWARYADREGHETMGLLNSEHDEDCDVFKTGIRPDDYECDCETRDFSWSSCDGCGSSLGGERYAFTWWSD